MQSRCVMRVESSGHRCWKCSNGAIEINRRGSYLQRGRSTKAKQYCSRYHRRSRRRLHPRPSVLLPTREKPPQAQCPQVRSTELRAEIWSEGSSSPQPHPAHCFHSGSSRRSGGPVRIVLRAGLAAYFPTHRKTTRWMGHPDGRGWAGFHTNADG